jgi:hypothetical protein
MELTRQAGNDPPLVGLMRVYKDYYPDVIVGDVTSGRASVFTVSRSDIVHAIVLKSNSASKSRMAGKTPRDTTYLPAEDTRCSAA